ncbi:cellulase family glycosylhydrolase [Priestia megaterium]|uniref:cellulase family glycosylhydrolase n=1 Tax=Priestia megaterium TaxID=1404 RepID=UPI002877FDEE|nr:cellulase family glycosylhydrolase [Priestia megaterium]
MSKRKKTFLALLTTMLIVGLIGCEEKDMKFPLENPPSIPKGLGVSIHSGTTEKDIQMIADAGFKWVRIDIFWDRVERKKGEYNFSSTGYDKLNSLLKKYRIKPYYILDYSNKLYENDRSIITDEGRKAFADFTGAVTKRYRNQGGAWEIWNEPNIDIFWKPQPSYEQYSLLVKAIAPIIRKNDKSGLVIAPAVSTLNNNGLKWLKEVFSRGILDEIDAVSVHPYRTTSPETVSEDYTRVNELIKQYSDKDIPVVSSEWGYSIANKALHLTETQQATYMTRTLLINTKNKIPVSIWYDWKNDGTDLENKEHNFGIVFNDRSHKLSYLAIQTLTTRLKNYTFSNSIVTDDNDKFILEFKNTRGRKALVYWTIGENSTITVPLESGKGKIYSMLGGMERVTWVDNLDVKISSSPNYLIIE